MARDYSGSQVDNLADHDAIDFTSNMTIAFWLYADSYPKTSNWIFLKDKNYAIGDISGTFWLAYWDGTNARRMAPTRISTGSWAHVVMVVASNDISKYYLNGTDSSTAVGNWFADTRALTNNLEIGGRAATSDNWDGRLAEIGFWDAALTQQEVTSLAKGFSPALVRPTSLKLYMPMAPAVTNLRGPSPGTVNSTAFQGHPRIIMPHRRHARRFTTASAPAGLAAHPMRGGGAAANPIWGYV